MAAAWPAEEGFHRRGNLKEVVAERIRDRIFSGNLRPGEKIDQDALASQLGVSKLPVREALISLESEALVRNVARRGTFVAALTRADIRDHYQAYGLIAGLAAERAAARLSDADINALDDLLTALESTPSLPEQERLNFVFHRAINKASQAPRVLWVIGLLAKSIPTRFYELHAGWSDVARVHHRQIMDTLRRRDPQASSAAMVAHLAGSSDYAVQILEQSGFWEGEDAAGE
ncbi:MAG: GntR family transcriptional regulator [Euzebyales bacterium]|nr:GntR family transcriptional regulator [Euzebyales bacterium]MBA3621648.1 GntR family transcriptional regulator [Euzebyales bacterium]